jgi:hypothetical protein
MNLVFDKRHHDREHNKPRKRLEGVLQHRTFPAMFRG